jgi:hypothetical protein
MDEHTRLVLEDLSTFSTALLHTGPGPDPERLQALKAILFRVTTSNGYLIDKKRRLQQDAERWYSHRQWVKHPGGPNALKAAIHGGIQSVISEIQREHQSKGGSSTS